MLEIPFRAWIFHKCEFNDSTLILINWLGLQWFLKREHQLSFLVILLLYRSKTLNNYEFHHVHLSEYVLMSEFILINLIYLRLLVTLKYFIKTWNSVHLFDARALKSERLAFQSCFKYNSLFNPTLLLVQLPTCLLKAAQLLGFLV